MQSIYFAAGAKTFLVITSIAGNGCDKTAKEFNYYCTIHEDLEFCRKLKNKNKWNFLTSPDICINTV